MSTNVEGHLAEADGHTHETACLNCGTALSGPYCVQCGQHAHLHRTIGALFHDILHGVLHFEGRTWATLPRLAWKPGELTRAYIEGARVRFVSPMAMFLFSVFVMFAVFQIMGIAPPVDTGGAMQAQFHGLEEDLKDQRGNLEKARGFTRPGSPERAKIDKELAANAEEQEKLRAFPSYTREAESEARFNSLHSGWKRLDKGIDKWRQNPGLMLYKLQTSAYKFSWLLIPLSVPFVALLFLWRRRFGLYDHAVFVTYSLAFMSFMGIVLTIASGLGVPSTWLVNIFTFAAVIHIYRHLKGTYELSHRSTVWRWLVLLVFIGVIALLFTMILLFLGLVG
ncbi:DUF3667 domain-containing protein [Novosphingobium decolorationis]|uniref:DUF3667 domain-containing protein n=1 Tax=Novosphingobium decolorationis TaxID=2698673 RepID=A0ABX8E2N7_9SPHN|nr:DUF3667 domain-containing protein [Novosphingobium decolorationis]QVM83183.1 DUF3667 domain-containing protein [Novosphingobium decolorationis]